METPIAVVPLRPEGKINMDKQEKQDENKKSCEFCPSMFVYSKVLFLLYIQHDMAVLT